MMDANANEGEILSDGSARRIPDPTTTKTTTTMMMMIKTRTELHGSYCRRGFRLEVHEQIACFVRVTFKSAVQRVAICCGDEWISAAEAGVCAGFQVFVCDRYNSQKNRRFSRSSDTTRSGGCC